MVIETRTSAEILATTDGPFEAPDDAFVDEIGAEFDTLRENLAASNTPLPEDDAFFAELRAVEEELSEGDIEGASTRLDELESDLAAVLPHSSRPERAAVNAAFERLVEQGDLAPDLVPVLRLRGGLLAELDEVIGNTRRDVDATGPNIGRQEQLDALILAKASTIDVSEARDDFGVRERAFYDDVLVVTQGHANATGDLAGVSEDGSLAREIEDNPVADAGEDTSEGAAGEVTFSDAVMSEIAQTRADFAAQGGVERRFEEDGGTLDDIVVFQRLEAIETALGADDFDTARGLLDELREDLAAAQESSDSANQPAVERAFNVSFLSPDVESILRAREGLITDLNRTVELVTPAIARSAEVRGDVVFQNTLRNQIDPDPGLARSTAEIRSRETALKGEIALDDNLSEIILASADNIVDIDRTGLTEEQESFWEDLRVVTQGHVNSSESLPDEFEFGDGVSVDPAPGDEASS